MYHSLRHPAHRRPPRAAALVWMGTLFMTSCSGESRKENEPSIAILCAAEALHQARAAAGDIATEDTLRTRAGLFAEKLPDAERAEGRGRIDRLADSRGQAPLVTSTACDALLSAADKARLSAAAEREQKSHGLGM